MEDRCSVLEGLKQKLLSLNTFTGASKELLILDEAIDLILDFETAPGNLEELQKECVDLQTQLNQCESFKKRIGETLQKVQSDKCNFEAFNNSKIGIVGGHRTDVEKLKSAINEASKGARIKFQETYDNSVPTHRKFREKYKNVDVVIVITGYAGHDLTEHADILEKQEGTPVIRLGRTTIDMQQLLLEIQCALKFN